MLPSAAEGRSNATMSQAVVGGHAILNADGQVPER
jgi:hypothetical protein